MVIKDKDWLKGWFRMYCFYVASGPITDYNRRCHHLEFLNFFKPILNKERIDRLNDFLHNLEGAPEDENKLYDKNIDSFLYLIERFSCDYMDDGNPFLTYGYSPLAAMTLLDEWLNEWIDEEMRFCDGIPCLGE